MALFSNDNVFSALVSTFYWVFWRDKQDYQFACVAEILKTYTPAERINAEMRSDTDTITRVDVITHSALSGKGIAMATEAGIREGPRNDQREKRGSRCHYWRI